METVTQPARPVVLPDRDHQLLVVVARLTHRELLDEPAVLRELVSDEGRALAKHFLAGAALPPELELEETAAMIRAVAGPG